jgi:16S rRNA (uracil1498-N3)-methyltransferase
MDRFFASNLSESTSTFTLHDLEECHHLTRVLRAKTGDRAEFINGRGILAIGQIERVTKSTVELRVLELRKEPNPSSPRLILACAIPKRAKFEDIIDKCTQLGVDEIIPMLTERTEGHPRNRDITGKQARFDRVIISAVKQSRRLWAPAMSPCLHFHDVVERFVRLDNFSAIPWLEGDRLSFMSALPLAAGKKELIVFIGPEGDFTPGEVALATSNGAVPISLGANVLRVDTAAGLVVGLSRQFLSGRGTLSASRATDQKGA